MTAGYPILFADSTASSSVFARIFFGSGNPYEPKISRPSSSRRLVLPSSLT